MRIKTESATCKGSQTLAPSFGESLAHALVGLFGTSSKSHSGNRHPKTDRHIFLSQSNSRW